MTENLVNLRGRHVHVLGGSRGIGAATARLAAKFGANVSIAYRSDDASAQRVVTDVKANGGKATAHRADVLDEGQVASAIENSVAELGPLNGLVISAGIFVGKELAAMDAAFWDETMNVNLRGTFFAVKHGAAEMRKAGGGSIVIYTSTAGQRGSDFFSAYATSKGAQILFMRSMAKELAPDGIRVNCIAPAWTETDMVAEDLDRLGRDKVGAGFPLGRIGRPEDLAGPTCFLLSDLSAFMTGTTVTVDGGMDMRG